MDKNCSGPTNSTQNALTSTEIFKICIYSLIFAVGFVGNGLVIFVTGYKMKTTVNSIWFFNLAIADFIFNLVIILNIITIFNKMVWHFGYFMCKFVSLVAVVNMFASIFLLTAISLDQCQWIVWAQNKRTLAKARIICIFVWILSMACSFPFVIRRSNIGKRCVYKPDSIPLKSLFMFRFVVGFLIPFLIIASSYIAIGVWARRLKTEMKLKPFRVVLSVTLVFFICWFPFHVQQLSSIIPIENEWYKKVSSYISQVTPFLVYLNSCLNPILYVFMCEEFKKKLKRSLLLVLESAFTEEHLPFRSSQNHKVSNKQTMETSHRHSFKNHPMIIIPNVPLT